MTLEKAIKILGLSIDFTESEFKKAYRTLCKANHPDLVGESSEEKQKELNAAADFIKKYLKKDNKEAFSSSAGRYANDETFDLNAYKSKKLNEIDTILRFSNYENIVVSQEIKDKIFDLEQYKPLLMLAFSKGKSKYEIDNTFQDFLEKIKEDFESIKRTYYDENDIFESEVKENLNYNCTLEAFYNQLVTIGEKYSKTYLLSKRLDSEISKYKGYEYYDKIEIFIKRCKNNTISRIKNKKFQNIEQEISLMHEQIINDVINEYESLNKTISELENIVKDITDTNIKNQYKQIKEYFEFGESLSVIRERLSILQEEMVKYQKLEQKISQSKNVYNALIDRYTNVIKEKNIITDYTIIQKINELFNSLIELFKKGLSQSKDENYFNLFDKITFKNLENDKKIKELLEFQTRRIYVRKKDIKPDDNIDRKSFFWCNDNDDQLDEYLMYRIEPNGISEMTLSHKELEDGYIPLDELLTPKNIVGVYKSEESTKKIVLILAETDGYLLYKNNQTYGINVNSYHHWTGEHGKIEELDKDTIMTLITAYLEERLASYDKKKQRV